MRRESRFGAFRGTIKSFRHYNSLRLALAFFSYQMVKIGAARQIAGIYQQIAECACDPVAFYFASIFRRQYQIAGGDAGRQFVSNPHLPARWIWICGGWEGRIGVGYRRIDCGESRR